MESRRAKIESRRRGAANRNVDVNDIVIGTPPSQGRRTRRSSASAGANAGANASASVPSSVGSGAGAGTPLKTPVRRNNKKSSSRVLTTPHSVAALQKVMSKEPASNRRRTKSPKQSGNGSEIKGNDKKRTPKKRESAIATPERQVVGGKVQKVTKTPRSRGDRKTPKSGVKKVKTPKLLRKSTIDRKAVPNFQQFSDVEEEPDLSDLDSNYEVEEDIEEVGIPERKKKFIKNKITKKIKTNLKDDTGKGRKNKKMIEIKMDRLNQSSLTKTNHQIMALDVLKQILFEYLSSILVEKSSTSLDFKLLKNYQQNIQQHFEQLIDLNLNNKELIKNLMKINKEKNFKRLEIYNLKKKHNELAVNLEKLRNDYKDKKNNHELNLKIDKNLEKLRLDSKDQIANNKKNNDDEQEQEDENKISYSNGLDKVELELLKLDKVINPNHGILTKLKTLNDSLNKLDRNLS